MFRSRRLQIFFKIVNFTENACVGVFLNKVAGHQNFNFIKKRLQQGFFPAKFAKFLLTTCSSGSFCQFKVSSMQLCYKGESGKDIFSVNFTTFLRTPFDWTSPDYCSLCLSENFEKFFRKPYLESNLFQSSTTRYSKKLFHKCFSNILYKNDK